MTGAHRHVRTSRVGELGFADSEGVGVRSGVGCRVCCRRVPVLRRMRQPDVMLGAGRSVDLWMKEKERIGRVHYAVNEVNCIQRI
jgi:hypothetical protein